MPPPPSTAAMLDAAAICYRAGDYAGARRQLAAITGCHTPELVARYARAYRMLNGAPPDYPPDRVREPGPWTPDDDDA